MLLEQVIYTALLSIFVLYLMSKEQPLAEATSPVVLTERVLTPAQDDALTDALDELHGEVYPDDYYLPVQAVSVSKDLSIGIVYEEEEDYGSELTLMQELKDAARYKAIELEASNTIRQLKNMASAYRIERYGNMTKAELAEAIALHIV